MKRFLADLIKRLRCKHQFVLIFIEWDGASVLRCRCCGKKRTVPL